MTALRRRRNLTTMGEELEELGGKNRNRREIGQKDEQDEQDEQEKRKRQQQQNKRKRATSCATKCPARARAQAFRGLCDSLGDLAARSSLLISLLLALLLVVPPALAVRIPATNCLPSGASQPQRLHWYPIAVDAVFDTEDSSHLLQIIVWGNVTGSQNPGADLPPPGDPYWTDPGQTIGKIVDTSSDGISTALRKNLDFLTYTSVNTLTSFCADNLVNATCPLGPVFGHDVADVDVHQLPSFNISHEMSSSYAFTSLSATFTLFSNESLAAKYNHEIGCVSVVVTPDLGNIASILKFLPLAILILTGFAVILAGTLSPWGTMDIFHWTSNYGRDADVLRLVTPGFGDCLQYIQFIAFTGALTLDYPGFFRPVVSQVGWSSLMFEESFVADAEPWKNVVDGIYITHPNTTFGLEKLGQLVGMAQPEDIWPGMMVWLSVMIAAVTFLIQVGFAVHWVYRKIKKIPQEDLRSKNLPFVLGNVVRIVFNFMLIPIVALSSFQLVVASKSPSFAVALAALTLALMICFASWVLYMVVSTKPKLVLFDDLPTLLRYGPLYNTYSDSVAAFALIPILLNFIRGIAIGAVQPSGVVQVVLLAICEVIQLLMIYAIRPYQSATSMNIYHSAFALLRLAIIMLMIAFAPSLDVTEGSKGWIGYTILAIHAAVLIFGFFLSSFQTIIEVVARLLGAGGDDITGLTRGGLSKIFGMRQLSRRVDHRKGPSRGSQLSNAAMLDADKTGYVMPGGRVRSGSAASLGDIMAHQRHRSSSAIDSIDMYSTPYRNVDSASSYMPGTPGEASNFSFIPSHGHGRYGPPALPMESADPYYRPPRRRRDTTGDLTPASTQQGPAVVESAKQPAEPAEATAETSQNALSNPGGSGPLFPASRPDYSTREVDFYYGVRGPALNSDGPGRKLGTGPADPTGPAATAAGWFRILFGGKTKEKGKGFEVVRSSRMPPSMRARNGGIDAEGNPVAMSNARHGPIDSDDDDDEPTSKRPPRRGDDLLNTEGEPQSDPEEPDSPVADRLPRGRLSQVQEAKLKFRVPAAQQVEERQDADTIPRSSSDEVFHDAPEVPRKSSKRQSVIESHKSLSLLETQSHPPGSRDSHRPEMALSKPRDARLLPRLPFDRQGSDRRPSSKSSLVFSAGDAADLGSRDTERPVSFGSVHPHRVSRYDPEGESDYDLLGTYAEVVDENGMRRK